MQGHRADDFGFLSLQSKNWCQIIIDMPLSMMIWHQFSLRHILVEKKLKHFTPVKQQLSPKYRKHDMNRKTQSQVQLFDQFNGRKVGLGHFWLELAPVRQDKDGKDHVCLRIRSVGSSVYHSMVHHIGKLVFSAESLEDGKWRLWQYFRHQAPCEPFVVAQYSSADELKAALENAICLT
jgi:hypothetical protein